MEGEALYVAVACHVSALYEQDKEASGARLSELPRGLSEAFTLGVLLPLEVTHTYELVQALVLQLLAAPTGITRADLKLILRQQLSALQSKAWVPAADIAVDGVLMALEPFLLALRGLIARRNFVLRHPRKFARPLLLLQKARRRHRETSFL